MVIDTELIDQLPYWYRQILDYQELCLAGQPTFDAVADEIIAVADNFFFQTMDAGAVAQWEQIFNIQADPSTESLDFRRARVLNRISTKPPYTLAFLYQKLDELIGPGQWTVDVDYPNYTLYIESSAQNQSYATEVAFTINRIKPAHIVYVNTPLIQTEVLANETIELTQRTYNYNLGGWGLGLLPFADETSLGVIKTPQTKSIQQAMLDDITSYLSQNIGSIRLNGSITISDISKTATGSQLEITCSVSSSQAEAITSAELLKTDGTVWDSASIYVPVDQGTVLKYIINVLEGVNVSGG